MRYATPSPSHHHLIAAAESFAKVDDFADACYRYYFYGDQICRTKLSSCLPKNMAEELKAVPAKYHQVVVDAALEEISYPLKSGERPAFCSKDRSACLGVSRAQYYRIHADQAITAIIAYITTSAEDVANCVRQQLSKKCEFGY